MTDFSVRFWGVRGSSAYSSEERMQYGCNTSCVQVTAGNAHLILDMGSGAVNLGQFLMEHHINRADILLSHFHYDHIEGIPFFPPFFQQGSYRIHSEGRHGKSVQALIEEYMREPYFPVGTEAFTADIEYCDFAEGDMFTPVPGVFVETIHSYHPNMSTAFKICFQGRSMVYLVDHEHGSNADEALARFCQGTELLIYDAPYSQQEYETQGLQGWGHSTFQEGIAFARKTAARQLIFTHHSKARTDQQLHKLETELRENFSKLHFAREGLELLI